MKYLLRYILDNNSKRKSGLHMNTIVHIYMTTKGAM